MAKTLRWGILGLGRIAESFANALLKCDQGILAVAASRSEEKAKAFAAKYPGSEWVGSYEALAARKDVDAIYVATPHPAHAQWAIMCLEAGKHVLCEKPLAMNAAQASLMYVAAKDAGVTLVEAFMYRCHPQTLKLVETIRGGAIGKVQAIQATFSFRAGSDPAGRLLANDLGGGGILDVGCYALSMARLLAGAAIGEPTSEPTEVKGVGVLGQTGVDEWASAVLRFPGEIIAELSTGVRLRRDNGVTVLGTEGSIHVPEPFVPGRDGGVTEFTIRRNEKGAIPQIIRIETTKPLYAIEADAFAEAVRTGVVPFPMMTSEDSMDNMRGLDKWRASIGLVYRQEEMPQITRTIRGTPLVCRKPAIPQTRIPGSTEPFSRLVMGVDNDTSAPHIAALFDDFYEHGGNAFDTAFVYGGGRCESILGQWVKVRGIRKDVRIITKGAHTPHCDPASLTKQLLVSLERLETDYVDLYMMHRDNPAIPVEEFVTVIGEHVRAGRIRAWGLSNWTFSRAVEACDVARRAGMPGPAAISNQFSLARMNEPVWADCVTAFDPPWRQWLAASGTPLFPWSSQARGFFARGSDPDENADPETKRVWYSQDNFARLERAREMASKRGARPVHIALAYVLNQPFPTFPLIGPRSVPELRDSLKALDVPLTAQDLAWLESGTAPGPTANPPRH